MMDDVLKQDEKPEFYIYRQIMKGRVQTGLVATVSVDVSILTTQSRSMSLRV